MTDTERIRRLDRENEELRDMLNQVAWRLGLGDEVHYYSGDNYLACQLRVLDAINGLIERESDVETVCSDAYEALEWVRNHGGRAQVEADCAIGEGFSDLADEVAQRLGLCIDGLDAQDSRPLLMDALDRRLMPEGMEWLLEAWPRFEDDAPVRFGEEAMGFSHKPPFVVDHVTLFDGGEVDGGEVTVCAEVDLDSGSVENFVRVLPGERVKRPAPEVLDADGVEIREKRDVWWICEGDERGFHAEKLHVESIGEDGLVTCDPFNGGTWVELEPSELYVNRPVLDADGVPIREGDTVYFTDGREQECNTVVHAKYNYKDEPYVQLGRLNEAGYPTYTNCSCIDPSQLTHTKPEHPKRCRDCAHWQKDPTADKMGVCWFFYHEHEGQDCYPARLGDIGACEEFMPCTWALAEREMGER